MGIVARSGVLFLAFLTSVSLAFASVTSGTIDSAHKYAWSDAGGYVNFAPTNGGLTISDSAITGYAWAANTGWLNFDTTQSAVTNDGEGVLGGFAWSEGEGWLSFTGVTIDSSGKFHGTATGADSTLTFDCTNCDVRTDWRPISVRPSASTGGSHGSSGSSVPSSSTTPPSTPGFPASPAGSGITNAGTGSSTSIGSSHTGAHAIGTATTSGQTHSAFSFRTLFIWGGIFLVLLLGFLFFRWRRSRS